MRFPIFVLSCAAMLALSGCSSDSAPAPTQQVKTVPAGEKAVAGHLSYSIIDTQVLTRLGDDPTPRIPKDRFMMVEFSISNSGTADANIPAIELIDDSGKVYNELTDGSGVPTWLGIIRHVGPNQTERGNVVFDAPAAHYKVKVSDESLSTDVMLDLPLSYAHEKEAGEGVVPSTEIPDVKPEDAPAKKK